MNWLKSGKIQCVIATVSWVEGVDIPNLTCVINAGGGKSEIQTLQKIGRGLRKTETKDTVTGEIKENIATELAQQYLSGKLNPAMSLLFDKFVEGG